ncbi:hypothetical protein ACFTXM_49060 [Streptomyces sp. NPDC056930]|uniref:hypothetical protein n=1 Tax=Streptomyces sp. NPDC056930 TaxID=3345967 RepID=UPI00363B2422
MSSLVLLVLLVLFLLAVVILLAAGGLAYITHRNPTLATPLTVAIGGAALLVACLGAIATIVVIR